LDEEEEEEIMWWGWVGEDEDNVVEEVGKT
jgi:hypothetical protein